MKTHRRNNDSNIKLSKLPWLDNNFYWLILLVSIIFLGSIMYTSYSLNYNNINSEQNETLANEWEYSIDGGTFHAITLPYSESTIIQSHITLKNRLPTILAKGSTILLRTSQQDAEVFIDGAQIYSSYPESPQKHAPSSSYHFVRMPTDGGGKEITITITSPIYRYAGLINEIYIGSKASHLFFLFAKNGFHFIIGLFIFSIGFLMSATFMFMKGRKNKSSIIYLGAFFACVGCWLLVESHMAQFILPYPLALTNISIFALTMIPVFLGLYYYSIHETASFRLGKLVIASITLGSFTFATISCIDPLFPLHMLPYYLVFIGIYIVIMFFTLLKEGHKTNKRFSLSILGGLGFVLCSLFELIFYLSNIKSYNQSNFLTLGLLIFCILMAADALQNFASVYQEAIKVSALTILAYTDSLTEIQNRTAFLERMSKIETNGESGISLAMFDINNLKVVNDTLGHLVGDAMLRHSVKAMKQSLRQEDELYRIGGDEFAAIIIHENAFDLKLLEDRLLVVVDHENQKTLSYYLSIAYGYATFSKECDKTLFDTLARADVQMYACKKVQKALIDQNINETTTQEIR